MGWQWYHMQIICTSLQRDNHTNTSLLNFYRPDALPDAQPTLLNHWRPEIQLQLTTVHVYLDIYWFSWNTNIMPALEWISDYITPGLVQQLFAQVVGQWVPDCWISMCEGTNTNITTHIFRLDLPVLLVTVPLGHFLFPHHPPGTHCLDTRSVDKLSTFKHQLVSPLPDRFCHRPLLPPSHPVPAPQIRFTISAFFIQILMYACMYAPNVLKGKVEQSAYPLTE